MSNRQSRRNQGRARATTGARKPSAGRKSPFSSPFFWVVGAVVIALGAVLAFVALSGGDGDSPSEQVALLDEASANLPLDLVDGTKIGSGDAPVKVTVFEDFQCRFCLDFTAEQEGEVIERFVRSGDLQLEYRHFPQQGQESFAAALGSQCAADQGQFWQYHNRLFRIQAENNQSRLPQANVGRFGESVLKGIAADLGLDTARFNSCFDNQDHLETISDDERLARSFGFSGTPSFVVNGEPLGAGAPASIEAWQQLIDEVKNADGAAASPSPTP